MSNALIIVGAGSSSRFGGDKLMTVVAGSPLIVHAVRRVRDLVDECVVVVRPENLGLLVSHQLDVELALGGVTRTASEMAGLKKLEGEHDLIGIHDGARPLVSPDLVEALYRKAAQVGGAVPVIHTDGLLVDRSDLTPVIGAVTVQTPQVFRAAQLRAAYDLAGTESFSGDDTLAVVHAYTDLDVAAVPGDDGNIKVTFPEDLARVTALLEKTARTEPR